MASGSFRNLVTDGGRILTVAEPGLSHPQVVTSTTHPASPKVGDWIFESDTGNLLQYQSATTGWTPPWNTAWGEPLGGYAQATSAQNTITTVVDVTSVTVTLTLVANRRMRVTSGGLILSNSTTGIVGWQIHDGAVKAQTNMIASVVSSNLTVPTVMYAVTSVAGSITFKARALITAGTINIVGGSTTPQWIRVEDLGPSAAPA